MNLISGVDFDPENKTAIFSGSVGLAFLMRLLLQAKFGEPFNGDIFLNPWINALIRELDLASEDPKPAPGGASSWPPEFLHRMGREIALQGERAGFWNLAADDRRAFIRDVAASPHLLSEAEIDIVVDSIELTVSGAKRLVRAAREDG